MVFEWYFNGPRGLLWPKIFEWYVSGFLNVILNGNLDSLYRSVELNSPAEISLILNGIQL